MRWPPALVLAMTMPYAFGLQACLGFDIAPGTLRCDRTASPPCPNDWICVISTPGGSQGLCHPDQDASIGGDAGPTPDGDTGSVPPIDPLAVGPASAPPASLPGRKFYVDPVRGKIGDPGTEQKPWSTLADVIAGGKIEKRDASGALSASGEVKPGDALVLLDGDHGDVDLSGYFNGEPVYLVAGAGQQPRATRLLLDSGKGWWIQGLTVSGPCQGTPLVRVKGSEVDLVGNTVGLEADRSIWSAEDWKTSACNGVVVQDATGVRLAFNDIRTVHDGIVMRNTVDGIAEHNDVDGFIEHAMTINGEQTRKLQVRFNLLRNAFETGLSTTVVHVNTCDGCADLSFVGNRMFGHRGQEVPGPFVATVAGLALYGGPFSGVEIVNNVVVGDHWHGIVVLGGDKINIVNNTTVGGYEATGGAPNWTQIWVTSDTPALVTVRNNLVTYLDLPGEAVASDNGFADKPDEFFVDWRAGDYRLRQGSPAIDKGNVNGAPPLDLAGRTRDGYPDQGAFERVAGDP